jgi:hypothetical protein
VPLLQEMPNRPPDEPDARRRSRPVRNHVLMLILVCLSGFLSSCIALKRVGQYPVTGTVVDWCTGAPVEGATVFLRYSGVSVFSGPIEVNGEPVLTNELGQFYIAPKSMTLIGGSGGLAGEIRKWPTVISYKAGLGRGQIDKYFQRGKALISPQDYQAMILEIRNYGENCPVGSRTGHERPSSESASSGA